VQHERELQQLYIGSSGKLPLAQRHRRVRYQDTFDPEGRLAPVRPRSPQHCAHKSASLAREAGGPKSIRGHESYL
jgi:hypothetical protein